MYKSTGNEKEVGTGGREMSRFLGDVDHCRTWSLTLFLQTPSSASLCRQVQFRHQTPECIEKSGVCCLEQ